MDMVEIVLFFFAVIVAGGFGAICTRFVPQAKIVRTKRIEVVDEQGKVRILLGCRSDGTCGLGVLDPNGKLAIQLGIEDAQPSLAIWDTGQSEPTLRARMCSLSDGTAGFVAFDADGQGGAFLTAREDAEGLTLFNKELKKRVELRASNNGSLLSLYDKTETERVSLYSGAFLIWIRC